MFACVLGCNVVSTVLLAPKLSEGADSVRGQLRGDKECFFNGVTNSGSFEKSVGKRCWECASVHTEGGTLKKLDVTRSSYAAFAF